MLLASVSGQRTDLHRICANCLRFLRIHAAAAAHRPAMMLVIDTPSESAASMHLLSRIFHFYSTAALTQILFLFGIAILAMEPARWLLASWFDPVWNSQGWVMGLVVTALLAWCVSSPRKYPAKSNRIAWLLLASSALVRLASQVLGISFVGAITLAVDIYGLALLLGTHQRARPLSPGWLACLLLLSLPLERVIQRIIGFGLQQWSASGACALLDAAGFEPDCSGISIVIDNQNVLVDQPCSGASGLLLVLSLFIAIAAVKRPRSGAALCGIAITLLAAWFSNAVRISLLAVGIVMQRDLLGFDVMQAPWHELIGMLSLTLAFGPVLIWASLLRWQPPANTSAHNFTAEFISERHAPAVAVAFVALAVAIVNMPSRPVDVSGEIALAPLPVMIGNDIRQPLPLTDTEAIYFTQYGGLAQRAAYGHRTVLSVSTTSPLRHLHTPDECLRAAGHKVRYLGLIEGALPAALYRSEDEHGNHWRITVSFVSGQGHITTSIAHAVWLWLQQPGLSWTMVQRIRRWDANPDHDHVFDQSIARYLDIPASKPKGPSGADDSQQFTQSIKKITGKRS